MANLSLKWMAASNHFGMGSAHPTAEGKDMQIDDLRAASLAGGGVDDGPYLGDAIGGKAAHLGVAADGFFIRSDVDAVDLVVGDVAMQPLDLGT